MNVETPTATPVQKPEDFISAELAKQNKTNGNHAETGVLYDADAVQRFAFDAYDGGVKFPTAHVFKPLDDARYLAYKKGINLRGNDKEEDSNVIEATDALWNDLIDAVENVQTENGDDLKSLIDYQEKSFALGKLTGVAIFEEEKESTGVRVLSRKTTVITETLFNDEPCKQTHILQPKTLDLERKFDKIKSKQFQQEDVRGISKLKPKIRFVPQDEEFAKLYDEMFISQTGFANGKIPLRFKLRVIEYLFAPKVDEKK